MQNNLTTLHNQFQRKHLQLSEIGEKIQSFMNSYKSKTDIKKKLSTQIKVIKQDVNNLQEQFRLVREDLVTYGQLPNQFIKMVIQLPKIYEGFLENRQEQLQKKYKCKEQQCRILKQKLTKRETQNNQLRQKISQFEIKLHEFYEKQESSKLKSDQLKQKRIIENSNVIHKEIVDGVDDLDSYIDNMEITIRQNDQPLFHRITQQGSQEQQEDSHYQHARQEAQVYIRKNKTARPNLILQQLGNSYELQKQKNTKPEQNFLQQFHKQKALREQSKKLNKTQQLVSKSKFWNNLTKNIQNSKEVKQKINKKKSLSQTKQNLDFKQFNKLSHAEKKILTSKITDFRKLLFVQKGIQRLGFKI